MIHLQLGVVLFEEPTNHHKPAGRFSSLESSLQSAGGHMGGAGVGVVTVGRD